MSTPYVSLYISTNHYLPSNRINAIILALQQTSFDRAALLCQDSGIYRIAKKPCGAHLFCLLACYLHQLASSG